MKTSHILLALFIPLFVSAHTEQKQKLFHLSEVRLLDSPFLQAQEVNKAYLLGLDSDRLLAPYMKEAGLEPKAPNYTNWEDTGLDGHIGGHYLSALSQMYAATGDTKVKERLDYVLSEFKRCQDAVGTGYLSGVVNGNKIWEEISQGKIDAGGFSLNGGWVPLYNIDKIYHGLRDAYVYTGSDDAKGMLIKLTDWMMNITQNLTEEQMQDMLRSEHGGLNEIFADLYGFTGEEKYLHLAHRFSHNSILEPLLKEEDKLTGLHANTQIPKVIGYKYIADAEHNCAWDKAVHYFWDNVVNTRTVVIGGNSVREHFHPSDDFTSMIMEEQGPESCNTYNMLRLSTLLHLTSPGEKYIGYYEQAMYNHILSSQHPEKGGFVYFTPMRPGHYRVYSQQHEGFWCCVGTGLENHARYGELIYSKENDNIYINMYIPSVLNRKDNGAKIHIETIFPESEQAIITVTPGNKKQFEVKLRYPGWVSSGAFQLKVNGDNIPVDKAKPGSYIGIERSWEAGDKIEVTLPRHLSVHRLPDNSDYLAIMDGPFVLAAKTSEEELTGIYADDSRGGHIASGTKFPLQEMPILVASSEEEILNAVQPQAKPLTYKLPAVLEPENAKNLVLEPFFNVHDARYAIYFPYTTPEGLKELQQQYHVEEKERAVLAERTIDLVYPGEQQPESDHFFAGEKTEAGTAYNRHWRTTKGWFRYELKNPSKQPSALSITFYGEDDTASFILEAEGETIGEYKIDRNPGTAFYTIEYNLPVKISQKDKIEIKVIAKNNRHTPRFYEVRLVKE